MDGEAPIWLDKSKELGDPRLWSCLRSESELRLFFRGDDCKGCDVPSPIVPRLVSVLCALPGLE